MALKQKQKAPTLLQQKIERKYVKKIEKICHCDQRLVLSVKNEGKCRERVEQARIESEC